MHTHTHTPCFPATYHVNGLHDVLHGLDLLLDVLETHELVLDNALANDLLNAVRDVDDLELLAPQKTRHLHGSDRSLEGCHVLASLDGLHLVDNGSLVEFDLLLLLCLGRLQVKLAE